jgi:hypothetical protein
MTITINFAPQAAPGYVPRKARVLHNVEAVLDNGVRAVRVKMQFSDLAPTYDHVVSVSVMPDREVL